MITNERQYKISKAELKKFEKALVSARSPADDVHPDIQAAMHAGLESQADELRQEIARYEQLKAGRVKRLALTRLGDLPVALVEGRIVAGLTQKDLANRVGLPEQQIQRYEGTGYRGVGLERLDEIGTALGLQVKEVVYGKQAAGGATKKTGSRSAHAQKSTRKSGGRSTTSRSSSSGVRSSRSASASKGSARAKKQSRSR